jgi:hypothetical protein
MLRKSESRLNAERLKLQNIKSPNLLAAKAAPLTGGPHTGDTFEETDGAGCLPQRPLAP